MIPVAHTGGLPHADSLGVPVWLQWLVVDARLDRRSRPSPAPPVKEATSTEATTHPASRERLVRATAAPRPRLAQAQRPGAATGQLSPARLLVLLVGFTAGWVALDRVRAVDALANFLRTDGAAQVARLGFAFAALLWVGAALAPVAPRGSALAFGVAGAIGTFLATASTWERRLEWRGAASVLNAWDRLPLWAGAAFALALFSLLAGRYRPGRRSVREAASGTIPAADSARLPDEVV
ncbi:MAG TPA: hypothetical protein VKB09_07475 [Thermomicrobiales bacterium]|nr:hypothetical protein [Thermomicrobiales bacterium]